MVDFLPPLITSIGNGIIKSSKGLSLSDLTSQLEDLFKSLSKLPNQTDLETDLAIAIKAVESSLLLGHKDEAISILNLGCALHLLRIFAPNPPFSDEALERIFKVVAKSMKGIGNVTGSCYPYYFGVLECLAKVRSVSLIFELPSCEQLMEEISGNLLNAIRESHPLSVKGFAKDLLVQLVDEADELQEDFIQDLLNRFHSKGDGLLFEGAQKIVAYVFNCCSSKLEPYLSDWACKAISNISVNSRLEDSWGLLWELFLVSPELLMGFYSSGALERSLSQPENECSKRLAVDYVARMFAHENSWIATRFPVLWDSWKAKFSDRAFSIRALCTSKVSSFANSSTGKSLLEQLFVPLSDVCQGKDEKLKALLLIQLQQITTVCDTAVKLAFLLCRNSHLSDNAIRKTCLQCILQQFMQPDSDKKQISLQVFQLLYSTQGGIAEYCEFIENSFIFCTPDSFYQLVDEAFMNGNAAEGFEYFLRFKVETMKLGKALHQLATSSATTLSNLKVIVQKMSDYYKGRFEAIDDLGDCIHSFVLLLKSTSLAESFQANLINPEYCPEKYQETLKSIQTAISLNESSAELLNMFFHQFTAIVHYRYFNSTLIEQMLAHGTAYQKPLCMILAHFPELAKYAVNRLVASQVDYDLLYSIMLPNSTAVIAHIHPETKTAYITALLQNLNASPNVYRLLCLFDSELAIEIFDKTLRNFQGNLTRETLNIFIAVAKHIPEYFSLYLNSILSLISTSIFQAEDEFKLLVMDIFICSMGNKNEKLFCICRSFSMKLLQSMNAGEAETFAAGYIAFARILSFDAKACSLGMPIFYQVSQNPSFAIRNAFYGQLNAAIASASISRIYCTLFFLGAAIEPGTELKERLQRYILPLKGPEFDSLLEHFLILLSIHPDLSTLATDNQSSKTKFNQVFSILRVYVHSFFDTLTAKCTGHNWASFYDLMVNLKRFRFVGSKTSNEETESRNSALWTLCDYGMEHVIAKAKHHPLGESFAGRQLTFEHFGLLELIPGQQEQFANVSTSYLERAQDEEKRKKKRNKQS